MYDICSDRCLAMSSISGNNFAHREVNVQLYFRKLATKSAQDHHSNAEILWTTTTIWHLVVYIHMWHGELISRLEHPNGKGTNKEQTHRVSERERERERPCLEFIQVLLNKYNRCVIYVACKRNIFHIIFFREQKEHSIRK